MYETTSKGYADLQFNQATSTGTNLDLISLSCSCLSSINIALFTSTLRACQQLCYFGPHAVYSGLKQAKIYFQILDTQ